VHAQKQQGNQEYQKWNRHMFDFSFSNFLLPAQEYSIKKDLRNGYQQTTGNGIQTTKCKA
jgi:hypothetical protein